jgi:hypothetical protein
VTTPAIEPSSSPSPSPSPSPAPAAPVVASAPANPNPNPEPAAVDRPAYIPEKFWDPTTKAVKADDFTAHFNQLSAFKAEQDVRAQAIPISADKYEVKLPEGFKPPEGMAFEFSADDPALAEARKAALDLKLDQVGFSRMLGIYAATKLAEVQQIAAGRTAEMAKLGSAGEARIGALETWLKAKVGDKADTMIATLKQYPVAANVEALEGIIRAFSAQGGTSFTQSGRDQDNKPSDDEFSKWSYSEQREFHSTGKRPGRAAA